MLSTLTKAALLSATLAQEVAIVTPEPVPESVFFEEPTLYQNLYPQARFWAYTDMFVGILVGLYVPFNLYAREEDCYSRLWQIGTGIITYNKLANGDPITGAGQWTLFSIGVAQWSYLAYLTTVTCIDEYATSSSEDWLSNYARQAHSNLKRSEGGFKAAQDIMAIQGILVNTLGAMKTIDSDYYWFEKGMYPTRVLSLSAYLYMNLA